MKAAGLVQSIRDFPASAPTWLTHAQEIMDAVPAAVYTADAQGRIINFNKAAEILWGRSPAIGDERWCGSWRLLWPDGRAMRHDECPMATAIRENRPLIGEAVAVRPDGGHVPFMAFPTPMRAPSGECAGAVNTLIDISERKKAERYEKALLDELNHRVRNALATVQSIAVHTLRTHGVGDDAREAFEGRLHALSRAHDWLSEERWVSADLASIARNACEPFCHDPRFSMSGDSVRIDPRTAVTLAMVFHELTSNAARHGALATPEGSVTLTWRAHESRGARELEVLWSETRNDAALPANDGCGLGSRLLQRGIAHELGGAVALDFTPAGLRCRMLIPLPPT